jgi:predicted nicotinamide N-methyase
LSRDAQDPDAFIRANTLPQTAPHVPEIRLHLASEALDLWKKTERELEEIGLPLPFWAFAWAGGQALARYLLDHPATVAGRDVYAFAAGSGIEAIAAVIAGARTCRAVDVDPFALSAIRLNAALNGVAVDAAQLDPLDGPPPAADVLLLGDVFYEKPMAERVLAWAGAAAAAGVEVLVGDPGRSYLPVARLRRLAEYSVPTPRALEDAEVKRTRVWRFDG